MAAIRFPGTVLLNGNLLEDGSSDGWNRNVGSGGDSFLAFYNDAQRIYVAPARYSNVRKVVFAFTFQHLNTAGTLATTFSLRIGPAAASVGSRATVETLEINPSDRIFTFGTGAVAWSNAGPQQEGGCYPRNGTENSIAPRQVVPSPRTTDSQTLIVEFERDVDIDFFADWDAAALQGEDFYMAYAALVERNDGGVFVTATNDADATPFGASFQMAVVQAPGSTNDGCTHIQATNGLHGVETLNAPFRTSKILPWTFRAADWDGLSSVHLFIRQRTNNPINPIGHFRVEVYEVVNDSTYPGTVIFSETFSPNAGTDTLVARTADILPSLVDGRIYTIGFIGLSGGTQNTPWGFWEVIQKDFSRKVSYHFVGAGNPALPNTIEPNPPTSTSDPRYSADQCVFDPAWFENLPDTFIFDNRFLAGLDHSDPHNTDQFAILNPSFSADIPNSASNQVSEQVSSTPDADSGLRIRDAVIATIDPLTLAGRRIMKLRLGGTDWNSGSPDDTVGGIAFYYPIFVPDNEFFTPELGPLFDITAFDAEGCATTAAGLGDNPGVLVLTNGRTLPQKFDPREMAITNAGIDTPYRGEEPTALTASVSLSPEGGLTPGVYTYRYTLRNCCTGKESDPNPVDIVVDGSGESPGLEVTLDFSGVTIPADIQICEICVYRTILGGDFPVMAKVGCFDPDDGTTFVDILPDTELDFINDPLSTFNAPMPCVPVVVEFRNRLFGLGDIPNGNPPGTVSVTNGSDELQGDQATDFDRCILGKFIQIEGDCTAYEVLELLGPADAGNSPESGVRLLLDRPYEGTTDEGLSYIICGHPNRIYISEPLEPESWPAINFLDVDPGDGDRLTGAVSNFNRLVVFKRRKTYVVAFREQPITEIVVPTLVSKDIGCIAPRSVAQVASGSVFLADRGLAIYDGRGVSAIKESSVMNNLFVDPDNPNYLRRDANGRVLGAAGVFYPKREQYLLLLPTVKTDRGASMVLVWDTELRNVTLLEFCQEFLSIEVAKDAEGNERVYLGDTNGFVWIWDVGDVDGAGFPNATGTVRGTITGAGVEPTTGASFLEDSAASFFVGGVPGIADLSGLAGTSGLTGQSNMGLAGVCVFWRGSDAPLGTPWQSRIIYLATQTRLYVTPNWAGDTPNVGDEYMIGPIQFTAEFKPSNYGTDDFSKRDWRQVVVHEPETVSSELRVELLRDFQNSDVDEDTVTNPEGETGAGRTFDLGFGQGRQIRPVGRLVHQYMGVRLSNFAPDEPVRILNHLLMMNPRTSK
jgi:hypothetical protein